MALAILGMALVVLVGITTNNVRNTQHAKFTTTATFLARAKMAELEDRGAGGGLRRQRSGGGRRLQRQRAAELPLADR